MTGRVIHTGQVVVDVTMRLDELPSPGAEVFADSFALHVGGGFNVLHAVRQMGAGAVYLGPVGSGLLGQAVLRALADDGVEFAGPVIDGLDTGICVAITDRSAERTFLSTWGAESRLPLEAFDQVAIGADDVVYATGYSFIDDRNRAALERLARSRAASSGSAGQGVRALVDASPMISDAPEDTLRTVNLLHPIWSANERETRILAERLGVGRPSGAGGGVGDQGGSPAIPALCEALAQRLDSTVISRVGADGAWWSTGGPARHCPSIPVTPVDTNGAGDAHSGVLCALLAEGRVLPEALRLANVAGALSTTVAGPATCPTREEILRRA